MAGEMEILISMLDEQSGFVGGGGSTSGLYTAAVEATDQEPSSVSPADSWNPEDASWVGTAVNPSAEFLADAFAVVNHNWPRNAADLDTGFNSVARAAGLFRTRWRLLLEGSAAALGGGLESSEKAVEYLAPTATEATEGSVTGDHSSVDDNVFGAVGADAVVAAAPNAFGQRYSFPTPDSDLSPASVAGRNSQAFVLYGLDSSVDAATLLVELWEGGALVRELWNAPVGNLPGQAFVIALYWDASELASVSGANVELRWRFSTGVGDPEMRAVGWIAGLSAGGRAIYDSGWVEIEEEDTESGYGELPISYSGVEPVRNELHRVPTSVDTTTAYRVTASVLAPSRAPGMTAGEDDTPYIGVLVAGKRWSPFRQFTAFSFAVRDESTKKQTIGGRDVNVSRSRRRLASFTLPLVKRSDFAQLAERFDWRKGNTGAFLVSFFPEDDTLRRLTTFWCTLEGEATWAMSEVKIGGTDEDTVPYRFTKTYNVREKL